MASLTHGYEFEQTPGTVKDREDCGAIVHGVAMALFSDKDQHTYINYIIQFCCLIY